MSIGDLEYLGIDELDEVADVGYSWRGPTDLKIGAPRFPRSRNPNLKLESS